MPYAPNNTAGISGGASAEVVGLAVASEQVAQDGTVKWLFDVGAGNGGSTQLCRGDGQDAGPAAVIEHRLATRKVQRQPAKAHARCGMASGAECQSGIEPQIDRIGVDRLTPAGYDPQAGRDANRLELLLGLAYPVVVGNRGYGVRGHRRTQRGAYPNQGITGIGVVREQRRESAHRPQVDGGGA